MIGDLIFRHRVTRCRSENAVDGATVIAKVQQLRLNGLDRGVSCWVNVIRSVIGGRAVRIVIVWIVVGGVVGKVIPWEIPIIQSPPGAVEKDEEATVVKMGMPSIPIAMPISAVTFSNMVADSPVRSALRKCLRWARD